RHRRPGEPRERRNERRLTVHALQERRQAAHVRQERLHGKVNVAARALLLTSSRSLCTNLLRRPLAYTDTLDLDAVVARPYVPSLRAFLHSPWENRSIVLSRTAVRLRGVSRLVVESNYSHSHPGSFVYDWTRVEIAFAPNRARSPLANWAQD